MMRVRLYQLPFLVSWFLSLSGLVSASFASKDALLYACMFSTMRYKFDYVAPNNSANRFWQPYCNYQPLLGSLVYCFEEYKTDDNELLFTHGKLIHNCNAYGEVAANFDEQFLDHTLQNATLYIQDPDPTSLSYTTPIRIDSALHANLRLSYLNFVYNLISTTKVSNIMCAYWVIILLLIGGFNHMRKFRPFLKLFKGNFFNIIRSKLTLPNIGGSKYHLQPFNIFGESLGRRYLSVFNCLLPTNQEAIILLIYFIVTFGYLFIDYKFQEINFLIGDRPSQVARYLADRTGILAFAQLPPLFLFGGRNNLLLNISGLPFSSFIILHKWISRVMVILAALHAYFFKVYFQLHNHLEAERQTWLWIIGEHTLLFSILILIFAIFQLRSRFYELFLATHILLALLFITGALLHVAKIGYLEWIYATIAFWSLDRVMRLYNLFQFGFPNADLEIIDETIVVTVPKPQGSTGWQTHPGQFAYIYFLKFSLPFWQSHPFTFYDTTSYNNLSLQQCHSEDSIKIYMKKKKGISSKLYDFIESQITDDTRRVSMRVGLEGPYAHHADLRVYDHVMLLAGGNGVPGPYYHSVNLIKHSYPDQTIDFIWTVKYFGSLRFFYKELLQLMKLDPENRVKKVIYITRESIPSESIDLAFEAAPEDGRTHDVDKKQISPKKEIIKSVIPTERTPLVEEFPQIPKDDSKNTSKDSSSSRTNSYTEPVSVPSAREMFETLSHSFEFIEGRPSFINLFRQYVDKSTYFEQQLNESDVDAFKSLAVVSCGPDVMCDEIRGIVASVQGEQPTSRIDLFEELQVW